MQINKVKLEISEVIEQNINPEKSVVYNFGKYMNQSLNIEIQKKNIEDLMKQNEVVKNFVNKLDKV